METAGSYVGVNESCSVGKCEETAQETLVTEHEDQDVTADVRNHGAFYKLVIIMYLKGVE